MEAPSTKSSKLKWLSRVTIRLFLLLIRMYQLLISSWTPAACRYLPTCSNYAKEALEQHGVLKGSWLTIKRLAKCHPLGGQGYDPVPKEGKCK